MKAKDWAPTKDQQRQWAEEGYFVLRKVIPPEAALDMRGVIKNELLKPEPDGRPDADPDLIRPLNRWGMKNGEICTAFPPEQVEIEGGAPHKPEPHKRIEGTTAG